MNKTDDINSSELEDVVRQLTLKLNEANPQIVEASNRQLYLAYSLVLGITGAMGFFLTPMIYHSAAAAWHGIGMLTDVFTCALPLFNSALAFASIANFLLAVFAWLKPGILGQKSFQLATFTTVAIMSVYILNLLAGAAMTAEILPH